MRQDSLWTKEPSEFFLEFWLLTLGTRGMLDALCVLKSGAFNRALTEKRGGVSRTLLFFFSLEIT